MENKFKGKVGNIVEFNKFVYGTTPSVRYGKIKSISYSEVYNDNSNFPKVNILYTMTCGRTCDQDKIIRVVAEN